MRSSMLVLAIGALFTSFGVSVSKGVSAPPPVEGRNGVVTTSQKYASVVGLRILKDGGNAVDAAVAVGYAFFCG